MLHVAGLTISAQQSQVRENSPLESFFSMFNTDRASRKAYPTLKQALADVFDYIERFYNDIFHRHLHRTTGSW